MYENKYLEKIKRTDFIRQLEKDAKVRKSAAARRLYTRLKKLPRRNSAWQTGDGAYYMNMERYSSLKSYRNPLVGNLNWKDNRRRSGELCDEAETADFSNSPLTADDILSKQVITIPGVGGKFYNAWMYEEDPMIADDRDGYIKVAFWLEHQQKSGVISHHRDLCPIYNCDSFRSQKCNEQWPQYNTDIGYAKKGNKCFNTYANKMQVFSIDVPHTDKSKNIHVENVVDVSKNVFNKLNHQIHTCMWCPCLLFFVYIFCVPAMFYMDKSDKYFHKQDFNEAYFYGKMSTFLYICGFLAALLFYCALGLFVMYFSKYPS